MKLAVVGANGFVGQQLIRRLVLDGHEVRAVVRASIADAPAGVQVVTGDVGEPTSIAPALDGADAAYYLVHSMAAGAAFRKMDRELATKFGVACSAAGVGRIVYLGALGEDPGSEHLASRQEVGESLAAAGTPLVELRAAVVLGAGSVSFEMLRYLTERLPFMVCPRWVATRIQPIGADQLLDALVAALDVAPGIHEVGGAEVTTYRAMIEAYARVRGLRRRLIIDIPLLTPRLSSYWVDLVTPVDRKVSHALIESLTTEVVVRTPPSPPIVSGAGGVDDAIFQALEHQAHDIVRTLFDRAEGLTDGVYVHRVEEPVADATAVAANLFTVGGSAGWYGVAWAWQLRRLAGLLVGERWTLGRPGGGLFVGSTVDWWTVARLDHDALILRSCDWFPGEAWLGYELQADRLVQVGAFRPKGIPGLLYWKLLEPAHRVVFRHMARTRAKFISDGQKREAAPTST